MGAKFVIPEDSYVIWKKTWMVRSGLPLVCMAFSTFNSQPGPEDRIPFVFSEMKRAFRKDGFGYFWLMRN